MKYHQFGKHEILRKTEKDKDLMIVQIGIANLESNLSIFEKTMLMHKFNILSHVVFRCLSQWNCHVWTRRSLGDNYHVSQISAHLVSKGTDCPSVPNFLFKDVYKVNRLERKRCHLQRAHLLSVQCGKSDVSLGNNSQACLLIVCCRKFRFPKSVFLSYDANHRALFSTGPLEVVFMNLKRQGEVVQI